MSYQTTAPTFAAGEVVTATKMNALADGIQDAWTPYTPTWTALTTNPTLGNGTLTGAYSRIGKTVHYRIQLTMGSTTTYGANAYVWTLPVAAAAGNASSSQLGVGMVLDSSTGQVVPLAILRYTSSTTIYAGWGGPVTGTNPYTLATGDIININGFYEAA